MFRMSLGMIICLSFMFIATPSFAREHYGLTLCKSSQDFTCYKVKRGDTWHKLFPDEEDRDIVRRVNRMNTNIRQGMTIAIPVNLSELSIYDVSPFPRYIESTGEKTIFVNQKQLAWAAYDESGELVWWGPISPGKGYCADVGARCVTPAGTYRLYRKQGSDCISSAYPRRKNGIHGGAPMPYCMHFHRGFALHGAPIVPGYPDSHGCVRLFVEDAKWLNEQFINISGRGQVGTKVIVGPI